MQCLTNRSLECGPGPRTEEWLIMIGFYSFRATIAVRMLLLAAAALLCSGCPKNVEEQITGESRELVIIVDRSESARGDKAFQETLKRIADVYLQPRFVQRGTLISIRFGGIQPETEDSGIAVEGHNLKISEAKDKLLQLANEKPEAVANAQPETKGTAVCETLLKPAQDYANRTDDEKKMTIVILSDLIMDPGNDNGTKRFFKEPATFKWDIGRPKNVAIRFYMVPENVRNELEGAWKEELSAVDCQFFSPGANVEPDQVPGFVRT